jgi:RNA polymerase sigma-70 factor (ECF subfamily)
LNCFQQVRLKGSAVYPPLPSFTNRLVLRAQRGSKEATNQLYPLIEDLFHYHARRLMRGFPSGTVDEFDLTQEALMKVIRRLSQYHGDSTGKFASWLRAILKSTFVDFLRDPQVSKKCISLDGSSFRGVPFSIIADTESPETEAMRNEEEMFLFASALFLPKQDCNVVLLRFWDGLPYEEIGRRMHCSSDAARMRFHRSVNEIAIFWRDTSEISGISAGWKGGE